MARPLRIQYPGAVYHVMNRGISRRDIFLHPVEDRHLFRGVLSDACRMWKIRIHAYSLMDNHTHLLLSTPLGNISRAMQHIDGVYTQRFNRRHHRDGPLLRGRFKSILVQKDSYFLELVRYIHLNGVRACQFPSARVDSNGSHQDYLHPNRAPDFLDREAALSFFHEHENPVRGLDEFVHQGVPEKLKALLKKKRWPAILGTKDFIEEMKLTFLKQGKPTKDVPQ